MVLDTYTYNALTRQVCHQVTKKIRTYNLMEENVMEESIFMDNSSTNPIAPIKASRALL